MPVPCGSCAAPVHDRAVTCPHCGLPTGIPPTRTLTPEERAAAVDLALMETEKYEPPQPGWGGTYGYDPELALLGGAVVLAGAVGAVVSSAVEAVASERAERESRPALPRAVARERTGPQPVVPDPSREPEPAPPPSDTPRFLK